MPSLFDTPVQLFPLRPRQEAAIEGIRQAIREGHKRIILQAPTGAGKTILASHIIAGALDKGRRPMFTVPQLSLIDQTIKRFEAQGIADIGVIQAQHARTDGHAPVQIASVQTLVRRELPDVDVVLIDEIHIQIDALHKILDSEAWASKIVIGLSATPWVKGMGRRWSKLVLFGTTQELIAEGALTPVVAFGVPDGYMPDRTEVRTVAGEYVEGDAEAVMSTAPIVGNVVKTWKEGVHDPVTGELLAPPILEKTFMFCVNRSHARKMQKEFEEAGVPCGYIDGTMDAEARERVFEKYRAGELKIIASVGCLDEETEVLTADGWVGIDQIEPSHRVAAWWNGFVEFTNPIAIIKGQRKDQERMVSVAGKGINIRVTDDHKMLWSNARGGRYSFVEAHECVGKKGFIPVTGNAEPAEFHIAVDHPEVQRSRKHNQIYAYVKRGKTIGEARLLANDFRDHASAECSLSYPDEVTPDECRFIGFWLGDGGRTGGQVVFSQSTVNHGVIAWFDSLLDSLGVGRSRRVVRPSRLQKNWSIIWTIPWGRGGLSQRRAGVAHLDDYLNKSGSPLYWGFNREQVLALLEGFRMADGNHGKDGNGSGRGKVIVGADRAIFDLLQAICSVRGIRTSLSSKMCRTTRMYQFSYRVSDQHEVTIDRLAFEEPKSERIWCVQSTTGAIITRRRGKVCVVGNCLVVGVDEDVRCIIFLVLTKSEMKWVQAGGRGLRLADGKQSLLLLDHSGTCEELGLFTDIHHETLDTHDPKQKGQPFENQKPPKPFKCKACNAIVPRGREVCPICGAKMPKPPVPRSVDGELVEVKGGKAKKQERVYTMAEKQSFYSGLLYIAQQRGQAEGVAAHRYRDRFGTWPNQLRKEPRPPSFEVQQFDKHMRIKWAKSQQKREAVTA